jgi:hypothetical protein
VELVDRRKGIGRPKNGSIEPISGPSAKGTVEIIGISETKVKRTRTILDYTDEDTKREVLIREDKLGQLSQILIGHQRTQPR